MLSGTTSVCDSELPTFTKFTELPGHTQAAALAVLDVRSDLPVLLLAPRSRRCPLVRHVDARPLSVLPFAAFFVLVFRLHGADQHFA